MPHNAPRRGLAVLEEAAPGRTCQCHPGKRGGTTPLARSPHKNTPTPEHLNPLTDAHRTETRDSLRRFPRQWTTLRRVPQFPRVPVASLSSSGDDIWLSSTNSTHRSRLDAVFLYFS